jgi:hypothetical protein
MYRLHSSEKLKFRKRQNRILIIFIPSTISRYWPIKKIDKETKLIPVTIGTYQEMLNLNVIETFIYNAIFGLL